MRDVCVSARRGDRVRPRALSMGAAPNGDPAIVVRWEDGGESLLPLEEAKQLSAEPEAD